MIKRIIYPRNGVWFLLVAGIFALDAFTKGWALSVLEPYEPVSVGPGFNIMLAFNKGVAFSFFSSDRYGWLLLVLVLGISIYLTHWLLSLSKEEPRLNKMALSLILGGALGNACDRLQYGHVVDFIQVFYGDFYWPVFNVADFAITVGAFCLIWPVLRRNP